MPAQKYWDLFGLKAALRRNESLREKPKKKKMERRNFTLKLKGGEVREVRAV
jgi:hypothetical protein